MRPTDIQERVELARWEVEGDDGDLEARGLEPLHVERLEARGRAVDGHAPGAGHRLARRVVHWHSEHAHNRCIAAADGNVGKAAQQHYKKANREHG